MINCIIVDDQEEAVDVIVDHLKKFSQIKLCKTFTDSIAALEFLETNKIALVFLDIEMPYLNGLEFIESLRNKNGNDIPKFIFTTGYSKYALSGYEQGVIDYLLKPLGFKRFKIAMDRLISNWKDTPAPSPVLNKEYFFVESEGSKLKLNYKSIAYIESRGNHIDIVESKLKKSIYKPLHYIEGLLSNHGDFIRVHKSFIVSINYIEIVKGNDIVMNIDGAKKTISIGGTYKDNVLNKFKIL